MYYCQTKCDLYYEMFNEFFIQFQIVLDLFTAERESRKVGYKEELAMESRVESDLELRHDIIEIMKVVNPTEIFVYA